MYVAEEVAKFLTFETILNSLKEITQPLDVVLRGECDMMINDIVVAQWRPLPSPVR